MGGGETRRRRRHCDETRRVRSCVCVCVCGIIGGGGNGRKKKKGWKKKKTISGVRRRVISGTTATIFGFITRARYKIIYEKTVGDCVCVHW